LLASGQINMRKVDGWKTLAEKPIALDNLQASEFAATQVVPTAEHPKMLRAAVAFTSEHSAVCYLPAHRIW
jgi:hypothetical protein